MSFDPMPPRPLKLAASRVLICNDDGIDSEGLAILEQAVRPLVDELWVVAPHVEQSAASHAITMRRPLVAKRVADRRFTVDGTPADCVAVAVQRLMSGFRPNLVLSGINRGGNMGEDAIYSGTVAAAMEAALLGIPAIALSLYYSNRNAIQWSSAAVWSETLLRRLDGSVWPASGPLNVNFPDVEENLVKGLEITRQGHRKIGNEVLEYQSPRGEACYWIGHHRDEDRDQEGTDVEAVYRGAVSVTPLRFDLTDSEAVAVLKAAL
jgi:5'-nucleotidase